MSTLRVCDLQFASMYMYIYFVTIRIPAVKHEFGLKSGLWKSAMYFPFYCKLLGVCKLTPSTHNQANIIMSHLVISWSCSELELGGIEDMDLACQSQ